MALVRKPTDTAGTTVVVYHAIGNARGVDDKGLFISAHQFEWQMDALARNRMVVPLADVLTPRARTDKRVAITFDDGFRNVLTDAAPVLARRGLPAALFMPTKWLSHRHGTDEDDIETLNADDLRELVRLGFEVGSHGHSHLDFSLISAEEMAADLVESRNRLKEIVGRAPRFLSWPFGRYSDAALHIAAELGFEAAFATDQPSSDRWAVPRVPIYPSDGRTMFRFKTSGRYVRWRRSKTVSLAYSAIRPLWQMSARRLRR